MLLLLEYVLFLFSLEDVEIPTEGAANDTLVLLVSVALTVTVESLSVIACALSNVVNSPL
jgi:hypothetical protein